MFKEMFAKSGTGKVSNFFFILFIALFLIFLTLTSLGQTGGNQLFDNPWLAICAILGLISIVTASVFGWVAIIKHQDKSFLVLAGVIIATLLAIFLAGEFLLPH